MKRAARYCCVVLALASATSAAASEPPLRSAFMEPGVSAFAYEIDAYARERKISPEAARLALARQDLAQRDIALLNAEFAGRLAGLFWVHSPRLQIVVRLTGDTPVTDRVITTQAGDVPVRFVTGAAATVEHLPQRLAAMGPALSQALPDLSGGWVDATTGSIVLDITGPAASRAAYGSERGEIERLVGYPVEFRFVAPLIDLLPPAGSPQSLPGE